MSVTGIIGQRGCGKSTEFKRHVRARGRAIIVDPRAEHSSLGVVVADMAEFRRYWHGVYYNERMKIILQPVEMLRGIDTEVWPADVKEKVSPAASILEPYLRLIERHGRNLTLAFDEVGIFGDAWHCDPRVSRAAHYGRHVGVSILWVARRPAEVPKALLSQTDVLYIYRLVDDTDRDAVRSKIGRTAADTLADLPQYHALRWTAGEPSEVVRPGGGDE